MKNLIVKNKMILTMALTSCLTFFSSMVFSHDHSRTQTLTKQVYLHQYDLRADSSAPFSQVNWLATGRLTALVDKNWLEIEKINDVPVSQLLESLSSKGFSNLRSQMLIVQRLADVMDALDIVMPSTTHITISAATITDGRSAGVKTLAMTEANYIQLKKSSSAEQEKTPKAKKELKLTYQQAIEDINAYQEDLLLRFAYLKANNVDHHQAIERIKGKVGKEISRTQLRNLFNEVTSLFIDGHAGPGRKLAKNDVSPFAVKRIGERYVALEMDGKVFVDADFMYITAIDNKPISYWRDLMRPYIAKGSEQMVSRRALKSLSNIAEIRKLAGLGASDSVIISLENELATKVKALELSLIKSSQKPKTRLPRKQFESKMLDNNIGYLRIAKMDDDAVKEIREWMPKFEKTQGLVIDVRNNGGGSRKAWLELMPYFMQTGETHIGNVSAYRLYPDFKEDHLSGGRYSYQKTDKRLNSTELAAINTFEKTFKAEWQFDTSEFSPLHYFMASKRAGDHRYFYNNHVVLLTNDGCYSATDIFVGAMKGWRNITLMGTATGGGSARTVSEKLPNSKIGVRLASMVSFQPNGLLYDGRGITVDKEVIETPASLLMTYQEDNQLDSAINVYS